MNEKIVIYRSGKQAILVTFLSPVFAVMGWLFLRFAGNPTIGWCFIILAGFCLIYGIGMWADRKPYLILTENGITDLTVIREEIEWNAIRQVGSFYFRGQFFVCILTDRDYKPDLIRPTWFYRLDRLYAAQNLKALYIRPAMLQINSARLIRMINRFREADPATRKRLLQQPFKEW